jgi:hypothetical protein
MPCAIQPQLTHQALLALAVDYLAAGPQEHHHAPAAVKRPIGVLLVN